MAVRIRFKSKVNKNGQSNDYSLGSIFVVAVFFILIILEMGTDIYFTTNYFDDFLGLVSIFYLMAFIRKIERQDAITVLLIFIVIAIGIISNILFSTVSSIKPIIVDIVSETKIMLSFFALKYLLKNEEKQKTINMLLPISKIYIIFAFIFALLSQFVDVGMTDDVRNGINAFHFLFRVNVQYISVSMLFFGVIVCNTRMSEQKRSIYLTMAFISIALAGKGVSTIFCIVFVFLYFYYKKHKKLSAPVVIIGIAFIVLISRYQINTYLLDTASPRHLFTEYAIKTANRFFPLGSGFASFGSFQAAQNYSSIYYDYGFHTIYGMGPVHGQYLNDNFWQMALGQFGWIGGFIYLLSFIRIFKTFNKDSFDNKRKALLFAVFIQYMIQAIGSATLSSSYGMIGFLGLALFSLNDKKKTAKRKINIKL